MSNCVNIYLGAGGTVDDTTGAGAQEVADLLNAKAGGGKQSIGIGGDGGESPDRVIHLGAYDLVYSTIDGVRKWRRVRVA